MRPISIFLGCLSLFAFNIKPLVAQSLFLEDQKSNTLAQKTSISALDRWELAFQSYTSNDRMFSFIIPGSCPIERPGARCGYPKPNFPADQISSERRFMSVYGGNYETGFSIHVSEYLNQPVNPVFQNNLLQQKVKFYRNMHETQDRGRLISSQEITVNGYKGIDLYWQGMKHQSGLSSNIMRIVVAGNRAYVINVGTLDRLVPLLKRDILTFLNGFKILKS